MYRVEQCRVETSAGQTIEYEAPYLFNTLEDVIEWFEIQASMFSMPVEYKKYERRNGATILIVSQSFVGVIKCLAVRMFKGK